MKPKDIGFVQLHIEKLVLAVAALLMLAILFLFVLGDPYAVELDRKPVSPGDAPALLRKQADQLNQKIRSTTPPFPDRKIPGYAGTFGQRSEQAVLARGRYSLPIGWPGLDPALVGPGEDRQPYNLPAPPMPDTAIARAGYGVLESSGIEAVDRELFEMAGATHADRPADFRYVSVGATFDFEQWIARLQAPQENTVPVAWWRPMMHVAGVFLLRQEAVDLQKSQWSEPQLVAMLPTQQAYAPDLTQDFTQDEADATVSFVKEQAELFQRSPFVPMRNDRVWLPPDAKQLTTQEHLELSRLQSAIQRLQKQIRTIESQLERQEGRDTGDPGRRNPRRPGAGGDPGALDPRNTGRPRATSRTAAGNNSRVDSLRAQLDRLRQDLDSKLIERDTLLGLEPALPAGPDPSNPLVEGGYPQDPYPAPYNNQGRPPRQAPRFPGDQPAPPAEPEEQDLTVKVWAHDLTAKPGKTYRYKVIVSLLNPLFRQNRVAPAQREAQYNRLTLGPDAQEISASPWSNPVTLDPEYYFFLIGGNDARQLAEIEAWRLYDGTWRSAEFDVKPGDAIGGTINIPISQGQEKPLQVATDFLAIDVVPAVGGGQAGRAGTRLYYIASDGQTILSRTTSQDRDNPIRIRLKNQATIDQQWRDSQATEQSAAAQP